MLGRYIPACTMLLAGLVTCIISIIREVEPIRAMSILLGVLILFYIIGIVAKKIIEAATNGEQEKKSKSKIEEKEQGEENSEKENSEKENIE